MVKSVLEVKVKALSKLMDRKVVLDEEDERTSSEYYSLPDNHPNKEAARQRWLNCPNEENDAAIEKLEAEIKILEQEKSNEKMASDLEIEKIRAIEAEKQRDHELQMALIQRDAAIAQAEAARLTAEASAKAQEQASASLDGLINGLKDNG